MNIHQCWFLQLGIEYLSTLSTAVLVAITFFLNPALAQITADTTLPINSKITREGDTFKINGGTQAGSNLFHSFQEFSVPNGTTAFFNNNVDIQNIISRVTGKSISNIDGIIQANDAANLFLINPNGIIFGPNASLNIGGSFIGSTANSLIFADGTFFNTTASNTSPLLTVSVPLGLQFGSNPSTIKVIGSGHDIDYNNGNIGTKVAIDTTATGLQVQSGRTLALVGGNIFLDGGILKSPAGRIEIVGVGSNQVVNIIPTKEGWKYNDDGITSFGDIQLSGKSFLRTTGSGGGGIAIAGKNISVAQQSILQADTVGDKNGEGISIVGDSIAFNESNIRANTYGLGNSGEINIINVTGPLVIQKSGFNTSSYGRGDAGKINIAANSLLLEENVGIGSKAERGSTGNAGEINIRVAGSIVGKNAGITTDAFGTGSNAGKINIAANSLQGEALAVYSRAENTGKAGEININIVGSFIGQNSTTVNTNINGVGNAGRITITANSFLLENGGGIFSRADGKDSTGNAGEINIHVADSFTLKGLAILTNTEGAGDAGKISIAAKSFLLQQGAILSSTQENSTGNSGEINIRVTDSVVIKEASVSTNTSGGGNAGNINIHANSFLLQKAGINSATGEYSIGNAGDININAAGSFIINKAGINTESSGTGNAGRITVDAESLKISNLGNDQPGGIFATSTTGQGGDIQLNIDDLLLLRGPSSISTTAGTEQNSTSNGGNITIHTPKGFIVTVPNENSDITANASGGSGGKIVIRSADLFGIAPLTRQELERLRPGDLDPRHLPSNDITAISQTNPFLSGIVELNRPDVDINRGLVELPVNLVDASQQITQGCTPRNGQTSRFVATGRGGLPLSPTELLRSPAIITEWITLDEQTGNQGHREAKLTALSEHSDRDSQPIVEAQTWVMDKQGDVYLVAQVPKSTLSFQNTQSTSCVNAD
ncbi:MAG: filamentous hemagglutinin N-terminal domain-containing protein [Scytonema sp. PMC 1069.18]|nr:filamentous hemagglutinin N-terminal domain-containing protein [Scytonema sp. PMC 1069.18]MEC4885830.1 filamentous hemagglutinin N-terminal domain-containing protein [Scytonema sp. PMC 1070.18]